MGNATERQFKRFTNITYIVTRPNSQSDEGHKVHDFTPLGE